MAEPLDVAQAVERPVKKAPTARLAVFSAMDSPSDEELVESARKGELEAFDRLMDRHINAAYAVSLALTTRPADAEDVCQDSFLVALEKLEQCREPAKFRSWLLRIVRNRAHNLRRHLGSRAEVHLDADAPLPSTSDPQSDAERADMRRHVLTALGELTELQRQVLVLFHMEGWNHSEIAEALEITIGGSRAALFKARSTLRLQLENLSENFGESC